ncbi:hypothetical protein M23134_08441 [Microscilla marina ATCC 23134]|uniref:STAS/SEC14 domain-containing protein n=2 Tax=Microscilla marina TaxID=1027 RepID=A1ZR78_MICM2|nr:hypothetical protein M23134_08441 [Microscilla marina ATCC 23134]
MLSSCHTKNLKVFKHTQTMKKLLDEHYVLVQLDEEYNIIEVIWRKFAMSRQYRQTIETAYQAIVEYNVTGWLSDMTHASVVAMEDQHWMKNVMIPKGIAAGIAKAAIVKSEDINSQKFVRSVESGMRSFSSGHFASIEEAREWLKKETVLN